MFDLPLYLWNDDSGQDIAEYAVMLAVILVLVVGTLSPPSQAPFSKTRQPGFIGSSLMKPCLCSKTKLLVRWHFRGYGHERARMWIKSLVLHRTVWPRKELYILFVTTHPAAAP